MVQTNLVIDGQKTGGNASDSAIVVVHPESKAFTAAPTEKSVVQEDEDARALTVFMEAIKQAQPMDRHIVRDRATEQFDIDRIVDSINTSVNTARLGGGSETASSV